MYFTLVFKYIITWLICSTLAVTRITAEDEAIYQCIAENSAGTNQASARLAVSQSPENPLPEAPQDLMATPLTHTSLQLSWNQPESHVTDNIIGYVLHIRMLGGERAWEYRNYWGCGFDSRIHVI